MTISFFGTIDSLSGITSTNSSEHVATWKVHDISGAKMIILSAISPETIKNKWGCLELHGYITDNVGYRQKRLWRNGLHPPNQNNTARWATRKAGDTFLQTAWFQHHYSNSRKNAPTYNSYWCATILLNHCTNERPLDIFKNSQPKEVMNERI